MRTSRGGGATRHAAAFSLGLAFSVAAAIAVRGEEPSLAPKPLLRSLDGAARQIAKAGRKAEFDETLAVMRELGFGADDEKKLLAATAKDLAKPPVPGPPAPVPAAAAAARKAAADLAPLLAKAGDVTTRERLARAILRLDDDVAAAHAALGEERVGGRWVGKEGLRLAARRGAIEDAIRKARHLDVDFEIAPSEHPVLLAAHGADAEGKRGTVVRYGGVEVHSTWNPEKLARVVREALRGVAVSSFLVHGKLEWSKPGKFTWILSDSAVAWRKEIAAARDLALLDPEQAEQALAGKLNPVAYDRRFGILHEPLESGASASLLCDFAYPHFPKGEPANVTVGGVQAAIRAGHLNWVCQAVLGARLPRYSWTEETEIRSTRVRYAKHLSGADLVRHESMLRLPDAGLAGCRAWMAYLASLGEDPPFADSLQEEIGMIDGDALLKATSVVEYLQESGRLLGVMRKAPRLAEKGEAHRIQAIALVEKALGEPLAEFEKAWRAWIAPRRDAGLAARLAPAPAEKAGSGPAAAAVAHLNRIRKKSPAGLSPVSVEESLSEGARRHALYLARHPDQAAAWPDAHEEYADREGFSAEGAWAGAHSVIAPGVASAEESIDAWMGTFYHRLPLLDAGLVRIGFALEGGVAVLDAGSLVEPPQGTSLEGENLAKSPLGPAVVVWPPDGMTAVPTRFLPELPNPVPGEDQSKFGYPITVQFPWAVHDARVEFRITLHEGGPEGKAVDCHVSTPSSPTNPEIAPDNAWCLIPRSPLRPAQAYCVAIELTVTDRRGPQVERFVSRFRT